MTANEQSRQDPVAPRLGILPAALEDNPPVIVSRRALAVLWARHPDQVRRHCEPIACDVKTRAPLYDADEAGGVLRRLKRVGSRVA